MANLGEEAQQVSLNYFATLDRGKLNEEAYWNIFVKFVNDVSSDLFQYVYANQSEFISRYGEQPVKRKLSAVWSIGANKFVHEKNGEMVLDKKGFDRYVKWMKKSKVEGWESIATSARMLNAEKLKDWKTYIDLGEVQLKKGKVSDLILYNWGLRLTQNCKDKTLRLRAARWFDEAAATSAKRETEGKGNMMSFRTYFEKLAEELKQ
ncbi:MAG: hypothetical protein ACLSDJ_09735 [Butyricimonas faecihominis]